MVMVAGERAARGWWQHLYVQVLIAILLGVALGWLKPGWGAAMKPLSDAFIAVIKMVIAPVIFLTLVSGIAHMRALGELGRVAARAFLYFIVVSSFALAIGLVVANVVQPGAGLGIHPETLDGAAVAPYVEQAQHSSVVEFLLAIIPKTLVSPLAEGSILQILFVSVLTGVAIALVGEPAKPVIDLVDRLGIVVFRIVAIVMRAAPIGAFAAMAFTVGKYGPDVLQNLLKLLATFYLTSALFVFVVLGLIARAAGFSIVRLIVYLKDELLLVLGTSSSEAALPPLITRLEVAGCEPGVVGLVIPLGYSFNLDGTNIYMTLAALFIAQACGVDLSLGQQLALLGVAMISSKGAAGVTGSGFITLAATLAIVPTVPIAGMALILGIDRFMSECRAITNIIGNAVATIVVAKWEGALDKGMLARALKGEASLEGEALEGS
jgi:aerobic C4-dicarboxylate transport protein